ncbi:MAG: hypothetical protein WD250_03870 [Egibacteraceae bacterium]
MSFQQGSPAHPVPTATRADLFQELDSHGAFRRDSGLGRIFHPGTVSYRQAVPENSLHILIDGNRVSAHIDRVSPLASESDGALQYPLWRVIAHNICGMARDVVRFLGGIRGDGRCDPSCDWVDVDEELVDRIANGGPEPKYTDEVR